MDKVADHLTKIKPNKANETIEKFNSRKLEFGDKFSEFLSFWVFIIKASDNEILTLEGNSKNFEVNKYFSFEDFEKRFRYTSIPGYWITYIGNNPKNTCGLIESYLKSKPKDEARDFKFLLLNI